MIPNSGTRMCPSLGGLGYWHNIDGAPDGDPLTRVDALFEMHETWKNQPAVKWPIPPQIFKGLTVDLTVYFSMSGHPTPQKLVQILVSLLKLPDSFFVDSASFFLNPPVVGPPMSLSAKNLAMWFDREHWVVNRSLMSENGLCKRMQEALKNSENRDEAPSRSTLSKWREQPDYEAFVKGVAITI
jgi:hypothetical protein